MVVALFSLARIFRRMLEHSFHACAFFFFWCFFFFEVEISSRTLVPLYARVSPQWLSERMFPDRLRVSSFPDRFPHYAWTAAQSARSDFVGSRVYAGWEPE